MALSATTLSAAIGVNDTTIKVASNTGFAKGRYIQIDGEVLYQSADQASGSTIIPVVRGYNGTYATAHPTSAKVIVGTGYDDFPNPGDASASMSPFPVQPNRPRFSFSASGALYPYSLENATVATPPVEGIYFLNGTSVCAMTVANPTTLQDGQIVTVVGNGKAAHTLTFATPIGDGGSDLNLWTFAAGGQLAMQVIAANGVWVLLPAFYAGTLTNTTITAS